MVNALCALYRITLLRPFLSDDSIVLGHASGLCGRGMVPVAMRLLTLKISLLTQNGIKHNERSDPNMACTYVVHSLCAKSVTTSFCCTHYYSSYKNMMAVFLQMIKRYTRQPFCCICVLIVDE